MMKTIWAVIRDGKVVPLEEVHAPEGTQVLITLLTDETNFWLEASEPSIDEVRGNTEDDVYAEPPVSLGGQRLGPGVT